MFQVSQGVERYVVSFEEGMNLDLRLKPQPPPHILGGQDPRPEPLQHETFQHMPGEVFPLRLDTPGNIVRQMNRDVHTCYPRALHRGQCVSPTGYRNRPCWSIQTTAATWLGNA